MTTSSEKVLDKLHSVEASMATSTIICLTVVVSLAIGSHALHKPLVDSFATALVLFWLFGFFSLLVASDIHSFRKRLKRDSAVEG